MQIHELPTATPTSDSDYLAFDTGSSNYKANFSDFDVSDNNVTFTSFDEDSPTGFKGASVMQSGTLSVIISGVSTMVSNVRYLKNLIGSISMGTTATTITGAVKELRQKIGNSSMGTEATTLTGAISELKETIGTVTRSENTSAVTIASSTGTALASITLSAGSYVIVGKCRFSADANGVRRLNLSTTSGASSWDVSIPAGVSAMVDLQVTRILSLNASTTFYLNAWQNSGSSLTCAAGYGTIEAVKLS